MSTGKCRRCGGKTDNFIEYGSWRKARYPEEGGGYWKCPECVSYTAELALWENGQLATDEITCPWCGREFGDSWEYGDSDDSCECPECGKLFEYARETVATYTSRRRERDFEAAGA